MKRLMILGLVFVVMVFICSYVIVRGDIPTYSLNSTNSTLNGSDVLHSLYWQNTDGLAGYIFSFCNGTWNGISCRNTSIAFGSSNNVGKTQSAVSLQNYLRHVCRDGDGNLHMVRENASTQIVYANSTDNGNTWTEKEMLTVDGPDIPTIDCYGDNITIATMSGITCRIYVNISTDNGATWTGSIPDLYTCTMSPAIATRGSNIYLTVEDDLASDYTINFTKSTDMGSTWSSKVIMSKGGTNFQMQTISVNGTGGANDKIYVTALGGSDTYFVNSSDSGDTWGTNITLMASASNANLAFNGDNLYVSLTSSGNVYITNSTDGGTTWTTPYQLNTTTGGHSITVNNEGNPIVFWKANHLNANGDIFYSEYNGSQWSTPTNITYISTGVGAVTTKALYGDNKVEFIWENGTDPRNIMYNYILYDSDGLWVNDSWVAFTGTGNWSNVTKSVNKTLGANMAWYVWANNTIDNASQSEIYSYVTTSASSDSSLTIYQCMTLNHSNSIYTMNQSITDSSYDKCLNVTAENVTIDCDGFTIDGIDGSLTYGIYSNKYNTTMKNCYINDWLFGIFLDTSMYSTIMDSTFDSNNISYGCGIAMDFANYTMINNVTAMNGEYGILNDESWNVHVNNSVMINMTTLGMYFDMDPDHSIIENTNFTNNTEAMEWNYADNVTFRNNILTGNGLCFTMNHWAECSASDYTQNCSEWDSYKNYIYNNIFNCTTLFSNGPGYNESDWNISKQAGSNIFNSSNPNIGGNYYGNYSGSGYSETCGDATNDGFCDDSYTIITGNVDYLPLSDEYQGSDDTPPIITVIWPQNTTYSSTTQTFNITTNEACDTGIYSLDGGTTNYTMTNVSSTEFTNATTLSEGSQTVTFWVNDTSGNLNTTSVGFTIDATAPSLTVSSPSNTTYTSSSVWFNLTGSETMDTCFVDYSGSNTSLTNSTGNWNYLGTLSNAAYTAVFWCNDSVGNGNMTTVSFTVSVDSGSPGGGSSSTVPEVNETVNETSENVTNPTVTLEIPGFMSVDILVPSQLAPVVGNEPLGYGLIGGTLIAETAFLMSERRKKRLNWKSYAFAGATALIAVWLIFAFAFQSPLTWDSIQAHAIAVRSL